jgi:pimeloyl-ACP methyl ester carboxylesterase
VGPCWDHSYLREPLVDVAGKHRLVFSDLRGCGRSTRGLPDDQYTPDAVVDDLTRLLDVLEVEQVDVLGFSYGGLIAQRLALSRPDRVRRLIVASSSVLSVPPDAFVGWQERDDRLAAERELVNDQTLTGAEFNRASAVASAPANVWRADALPGYLERLEKVRFTDDWNGPYLSGILPSPRYPDAVERFAALGLPMLLLQGQQDMTFPAELADQAAALIPSATTVILDQAGHMAHIDQPTAWLAAVAAFVD